MNAECARRDNWSYSRSEKHRSFEQQKISKKLFRFLTALVHFELALQISTISFEMSKSTLGADVVDEED